LFCKGIKLSLSNLKYSVWEQSDEEKIWNRDGSSNRIKFGPKGEVITEENLDPRERGDWRRLCKRNNNL
jgi:hypothetical protein